MYVCASVCVCMFVWVVFPGENLCSLNRYEKVHWKILRRLLENLTDLLRITAQALELCNVSQVTRSKESRYACERAMSQMCQSDVAYDRVVSHTWMRVMPHTRRC